MNLYERYLASPFAGSTYYAEGAKKHDTCPDCCPGQEDNCKPGVLCPRCFGTGVIRTDDYIDEIDDGDRPICCPKHPDTDLVWDESWGEWQCPEDGCDFVWSYPEEDGISDRERL